METLKIETIAEARIFAHSLMDTVREMVIVLDENLTVLSANHSFYSNFKYLAAETEGRRIYELGKNQWDNPKLRELLEEIIPRNTELRDFELEQDFPDLGRRTLHLNARRIEQESGVNFILLAIEDITERIETLRAVDKAVKIIDSSPDIIVHLDADRKYLFANREFLGITGKREGEIEGKELAEAGLQGEMAAQLNQAMDEAARNHQEQIIEIEYGERCFLTVVKADFDEKGNISSFILFSRDTTERKKTEEQLRESEGRFRAVLENSQDVVYRFDFSTNAYDYISPVIKEIIGFSAEEFSSMSRETILERIHRDDIKKVNGGLASVMTPGTESGQLEYRFRGKSGDYRWLADRFNVILDEGGSPSYLVGMVRDVTGRKEMEEMLLASWDTAENRAREAEAERRIMEAVFDNVPEGFAIIEAETNRVLMVSRYLSEIVGMNRDDFRKMELPKYAEDLEITDGRKKPLLLTDLPIWRCIIRSLRLGEVIINEECPIAWPDGNRGTISIIAAPVRDAQGVITHAVISFRDITESKEMETALRRAEFEFRTLVENSPDLILRLDHQMRYQFVNTAYERMTGIPREQFIGKTNREMGMPEEYSKPWEEGILKAIESGREINMEFSFRSLFGRRDFWGRIIPEFEKNGRVESVILMARDITERKQAEEHIRYMSFHDTVTGLYNRAYFEEEVRRLDTARSLPVSFIMGDVNNLKLVNDTFGHTEGDILLRRIAEILMENCRDEDIIARWGGDEFAVILPGTGAATAERICSRIRNMARSSEGTVITPSIALGTAEKTRAEDNIYRIIREAEEKMYDNKLSGVGENQENVISSLLRRLREKWPEFDEHLQRMQDLARIFGSAIDLSESQMEDLLLLVRLHDIGKAAIPDKLLRKPERLNNYEWEAVKRHPEAGYRIVKTFPGTAKISDAILAQREKWDGTGYPRGLRQKEIPFMSRVFSIIDSYDTMTHERPYERTFTRAEAENELRHAAGKQLDPELSEVFLSVI